MFDDLRDQYFPCELPGGVVAQPADFGTYQTARELLFDLVFPHWAAMQRYEAPEARRAQTEPLNRIFQCLHHEHIVFYDGEKPVGWSTGRMENPITFRMSSSGLLPDYRRRGIYTAFTRRLLDYLKAVGYERVSSHHHPTNRAVLTAKLKLGFNITATILSEDVGAVVEVICYLYQDRFRAFEQSLNLEPDFTRAPPPEISE